MGAISQLRASQTPALGVIPISDGSGAPDESLNDWVSDGSGGGAVDAENVFYSNGSSGIPASNVQDAIDYLALSSGSGSLDIQAALDTISTVQGTVLFRGPTQWEALLPGIAGGFLQTNGFGFNPTWSLGSSSLYADWVAAVDAAGGTYETDSKPIADELASALVAAPYFGKIVYLLPLLGANLIAARVPLVDTLAVGIATNDGFVDADFDQATGLQATGAAVLDLGMKTSALGAGDNGGFGYWENNWASPGAWAMGVYPGTGDNSELYGINLSTVDDVALFYGNSGLAHTTFGNGHWYGQRSGALDRKVFLDGANIIANTAAHNTANINLPPNIQLMGIKGAPGTTTYYYGTGRCAVAYLTDGTLTDGEAAAFHALLYNKLIIPTGR